jgi:hypothetical protein
VHARSDDQLVLIMGYHDMYDIVQYFSVVWVDDVMIYLSFILSAILPGHAITGLSNSIISHLCLVIALFHLGTLSPGSRSGVGSYLGTL